MGDAKEAEVAVAAGALAVTNGDYFSAADTVIQKDGSRLSADEFRKLFAVLKDTSDKIQAVAEKVWTMVPEDKLLDGEIPKHHQFGIIQAMMWVNMVSAAITLGKKE